MACLTVFYDWFMTIVGHMFFINLVLAIVLVVFDRKKPSATLAWIFVFLFIPVFGFLLYLLIGQDLRKRKMFAIKGSEEVELQKNVHRQQSSISRKHFEFSDPGTNNYASLISLNLASNEALLSQDNQVKVFYQGTEFFAAMLHNIHEAKSFIHFEYYIFRNDQTGEPFIEAFIEAAERGCEVRLLFDGMGCKDLKKSFFRKLNRAGIETAVFFPSFLGNLNVRVNYRNHRKICVIDGLTAYVGGFNIGDEYAGKSKRFGNWRDTSIQIKGSSIAELNVRFVLDWRFATGIDLGHHLRYFPNAPSLETGDVAMQIVTSGPDSKWPSVRDGFLQIISGAQNHIYIQSPYFVPDEALLSALRVAALSGVDVRIIIPGKPDHPFVKWAAMSYIGDLLDSGVRFFFYHNGFIHAKTITADGFASTIGTANFDVRSFQLNFEITAFIYSQDIAMQMDELFIKDMMDSQEITLEDYAKRSIGIKTKEAVSRMISPLL